MSQRVRFLTQSCFHTPTHPWTQRQSNSKCHDPILPVAHCATGRIYATQPPNFTPVPGHIHNSQWPLSSHDALAPRHLESLSKLAPGILYEYYYIFNNGDSYHFGNATCKKKRAEISSRIGDR
jgi:hypothetical protein